MPLVNKGKTKARNGRRSRSRNSTPLSSTSTTTGIGLAASIPPPALTAYLGIETARLLTPSAPQYAEMMEKLELKQGMPEPKHLDSLVEQLNQLSEAAKTRSQTCYSAITALSEKRKEIAEQERARERQERETESRRARLSKDTDESEVHRAISKSTKLKKRKSRDERPPARGAHGVARQDGVEVKQEEDAEKQKRSLPLSQSIGTICDHPSPSKRARLSPGSSSLSEIAQSPDTTIEVEKDSPKKLAVSAESSDDERQPPPAPPMTQHVYFPHPLAADPTIYHIREVTPGMTEEEKKEIYNVTAFPTKDLSDQIAGSPPDKDFSNTKPANQVSANTFLGYVEPYLRPLTEEDVAFLRERGDRTTPFLIPSRGRRHYTEIWAAEDGNTALVNIDNAPTTEATGSADDMNDELLGEDKISGGALANRLISLLRFEHRPSPVENGVNGTSTNETNGLLSNDPMMDFDELLNSSLDATESKPLRPAAAVVDQYAPKQSTSNGDLISNPPNGNGTGHPPADERIKLELRHLGFLGVDEEPDFDGHHDDDISVRLRLLQAELKRVTITNGARKARLLDIAKERLAYQEYSTIHDDLDSQVQQAYLKRTRTLGKSKKGSSHHSAANRPRPNTGAAGAATVPSSTSTTAPTTGVLNNINNNSSSATTNYHLNATSASFNTAANSTAVANGVNTTTTTTATANTAPAPVPAPAPAIPRRRDIGEAARMLMDRRKRWEDCIGPVFEGMRNRVPTSVDKGGESLWDEMVMERYEKMEREGFEEENEG